MFAENVLFAFALTVFAGLSTGIGSLMALFSKKFNSKFLAASLGFSAGVMIYVSLIEIFPKARVALCEVYSEKNAYYFTVLSFFAGIALIGLIDKLVPSFENPHEIRNVVETPEEADKASKMVGNSSDKKLLRMGIFSALAIGIHNFPEGLATFMAALHDPSLGISISAAIAIHNIPEGIAVSVPIYFATRNRTKAFLYSFMSGFAEPVGAIIGYLLLKSVLGNGIFGFVFAGVAGIMVYISLNELLPTAEEYGEHHIAIGGLIAGMAVMALSLVLFA